MNYRGFLAIPVSLGAGVAAAYAMQLRAEERDWSSLLSRTTGSFVGLPQRQHHIIIKGSGTPVVFLEASTGGMTQDWTRVVEEISKHTTVVAYDRFGLGFSSGPECDTTLVASSSTPRNTRNLAKELRQLLVQVPNVDPSEGIILVGHGQGAAIVVDAAREMSSSSRGAGRIGDGGRDGDYGGGRGGGGGRGSGGGRVEDAVLAGVVLLDPVCGVRSEHKSIGTDVARAIESMEESTKILARLSKLGVARIFMSLPNSIQTLSSLYIPSDCIAVQLLSSRSTHRAFVSKEVSCYEEDDALLSSDVRSAVDASSYLLADDVPVLVVGHGIASMFKDLASVGGTEGAQERLEKLEYIWQRGQERLSRAMSSNATYVRGNGAEHHMPQKNIRMTVDAVRSILNASRRKGGEVEETVGRRSGGSGGSGGNGGSGGRGGSGESGGDAVERFKQKYHTEKVTGVRSRRR